MKIRLVTTGRQDTFDVGDLKTLPVWMTWANNAFKYSRCQDYGLGLMPVYVWTPAFYLSPGDGPGSATTYCMGIKLSEEMEAAKFSPMGLGQYPWLDTKRPSAPAGDTATEHLHRKAEGDRVIGKMADAMDAHIKDISNTTMQLIAAEACEKLFERVVDDPENRQPLLEFLNMAQETPISNRWRNVALKAAAGYIHKAVVLDGASWDKGHAEGYELGMRDGAKARNEHWSGVIAQMSKNHNRALKQQGDLTDSAYSRGYAEGQLRGQDEGYIRGTHETEKRCNAEHQAADAELRKHFQSTLERERQDRFQSGWNAGHQKGVRDGEMNVQRPPTNGKTYAQGFEAGVAAAEHDIQDRMDRFAANFRDQRIVVATDPGSIDWSVTHDTKMFSVDKGDIMSVLYPNAVSDKAKAPYTETDVAGHLASPVKQASISRVANGYTVQSYDPEMSNSGVTVVFAKKEDTVAWLAKNLA